MYPLVIHAGLYAGLERDTTELSGNGIRLDLQAELIARRPHALGQPPLRCGRRLWRGRRFDLALPPAGVMGTLAAGNA